LPAELLPPGLTLLLLLGELAAAIAVDPDPVPPAEEDAAGVGGVGGEGAGLSADHRLQNPPPVTVAPALELELELELIRGTWMVLASFFSPAEPAVVNAVAGLLLTGVVVVVEEEEVLALVTGFGVDAVGLLILLVLLLASLQTSH